MTTSDPYSARPGAPVDPLDPAAPDYAVTGQGESTGDRDRQGDPQSETEALRRQIEETRSDLSRDVNALGEAAAPGNIARRQAEKVGDRVTGAGRKLKETIMGSDDPYDDSAGMSDRAGGAMHSARDSAGEGLQSARETVQQAPAAARRQTRGNPLAAGVIALGAGWLLGSLLPASEKERELAVQVKEQAKEKGQPLVEEAKSAAQETAEQLKEPAREAAEQVKSSAQDSVENVKEEGRGAADDVKSSAQGSKDNVQRTQQDRP